MTYDEWVDRVGDGYVRAWRLTFLSMALELHHIELSNEINPDHLLYLGIHEAAEMEELL